METRAQWDELYDSVKESAYRQISALFAENNNFVVQGDLPGGQLSSTSRRFKLKLIQVIHKYYLNATIGEYVYPGKHWIRIIQACVFLKVRKKRVGKIISGYLSVYFDQTNRFQQLLPEIDFNGYHHQAYKIILACVLNTFINQPLFGKKQRGKELDIAFRAGYYIAITYAVADVSLDSGLLTKKEKDEFNERVLNALSNGPRAAVCGNNILDFVSVLKSESDKALPFADFERAYSIMYLLEKVQYEEMLYQPEYDTTGNIIYKTMLLALKTQLSLMVMNIFDERSIPAVVESGIIYSLYVQLDDDLRDIRQDLKDNVRTLFTAVIDPALFSPHALMLHLITRLGSRHRAGWMYGEYLEHLERNRSAEVRSLDNDKIHLFISAITGRAVHELLRSPDAMKQADPRQVRRLRPYFLTRK